VQECVDVKSFFIPDYDRVLSTTSNPKEANIMKVELEVTAQEIADLLVHRARPEQVAKAFARSKCWSCFSTCRTAR